MAAGFYGTLKPGMPAGSHAFSVGSMRCTVLSDGYFSYPAEWLFSNVEPATLRQALAGRHLPPDEVLSPYTCLLIETGRHVVLADTGGGTGCPTTGAIRARLDQAGLRPQDIDTVILSHAHPDHLGGAVDREGRSAFPNARYVISETEWEFWMGGRTDLSAMDIPDEVKRTTLNQTRRCLPVLRHQVETICRETEIVPGLWAIPAPGHTPGHLAMLLASGNDRLLNIADAALHPLHLERPDWHNAIDLARDAAAITRRCLLERAVAEDMRVMGFHFPFPSIGRIEPRREGGWEWSPGW